MRIAVFLADQKVLGSAGVRIRYERLRPALATLGHRIDLRVIGVEPADADADADIAIITKTYNARAIALARQLRQAGIAVGIDIFDDYFSQQDDARMTPQRGWLAQVRPHLDFALCGTSPMKARLAGLMPGLPVHILCDSHDLAQPGEIADLAEEAAKKARASRLIEIAWFGIGDNPQFPVGLDDLAAFGPHLVAFHRRGWRARLRVLTNPRAMTLDRLAALRRLPVPCEVEEWSLERQDALLRRALLAFLPVNAQGFSTAKSLNRAVTALVGGAQVLSVGYPLYARLDAMIYRDAARLLADLEAGCLRLRRESVPQLMQLLAGTGDPATEANRLADFLRLLHPPRAESARPLLVVLGANAPADAPQTLARLGALAVAHPFGPAPAAGADLTLALSATPGVAVVTAELSARAKAHLRPGLLDKAGPAPGRPLRLSFPASCLPPAAQRAARLRCGKGTLARLAAHEPGLTLLAAVATHLFGQADLVISDEPAPLGLAPFPAARLAGVEPQAVRP